jgi:hypothetical protein
MAWDRLRLMIAIVVLAFGALVFVLNRSTAVPAASDRRRERSHRATPRTVAAVVLVLLGVVALVSRRDGGDDIRLEIQDCRDGRGYATPCPWPPEAGTNPPVVGERTLTARD